MPATQENTKVVYHKLGIRFGVSLDKSKPKFPAQKALHLDKVVEKISVFAAQ
jgi:hypothetical protein